MDETKSGAAKRKADAMSPDDPTVTQTSSKRHRTSESASESASPNSVPSSVGTHGATSVDAKAAGSVSVPGRRQPSAELLAKRAANRARRSEEEAAAIAMEAEAKAARDRHLLEVAQRRTEKVLKIQRLTQWLKQLVSSGGLHYFGLAVKKNEGKVSSWAQVRLLSCRPANEAEDGKGTADGDLDVWVQLEDDFSIQLPARQNDDDDGRKRDDGQPKVVGLLDRMKLCFTNTRNSSSSRRTDLARSTWTYDYELSETNTCRFRLLLGVQFAKHVRTFVDTLLSQHFNIATDTQDHLNDIICEYAFDSSEFTGIDKDSESDSDWEDEASHEAALEAAESKNTSGNRSQTRDHGEPDAHADDEPDGPNAAAGELDDDDDEDDNVDEDGRYLPPMNVLRRTVHYCVTK